MNAWIWVIIILIVVLAIVGVGILIYRSIIVDPAKVNPAGNKCSSTDPCPEKFQCSLGFCQSNGIATGQVGAFCTPDGQFPTTPSSTSPGCDTTQGINCVAGVCVQSSPIGSTMTLGTEGMTLGTEGMTLGTEGMTLGTEGMTLGTEGMTLAVSSLVFSTDNQGYPQDSDRECHHDQTYSQERCSNRSSRYSPEYSRGHNHQFSGRSRGQSSGRSSQSGNRYISQQISERSSASHESECSTPDHQSYQNNWSEMDFKEVHDDRWAINYRGDVCHRHSESSHWDIPFPAGFTWAIGEQAVQLTAESMAFLTSDPGKVVVSFKSTNRQFPHTVFYEIISNHDPREPYHLMPWTKYEEEKYDGQIFCPSDTDDHQRKSGWKSIFGSKIRLETDGQLLVEGHRIGSSERRLFVPSSVDPSREYLPT